MLLKLSERIIDNYQKKDLISNEERIIYVYGVKQIISLIINIISFLMCGIVFGEILGAMVFALSFMMIRTYAGGYHASTPVRCYIVTMITTIGAILVMKYIAIPQALGIALLFISSVIIVVLSPVDTEGKELDSLEKKIYRGKTLLIWGVELSIAIVCMLLNIEIVTIAIMLSHTVLAFAQIVQELKYFSFT